MSGSSGITYYLNDGQNWRNPSSGMEPDFFTPFRFPSHNLSPGWQTKPSAPRAADRRRWVILNPYFGEVCPMLWYLPVLLLQPQALDLPVVDKNPFTSL